MYVCMLKEDKNLCKLFVQIVIKTKYLISIIEIVINIYIYIAT